MKMFISETYKLWKHRQGIMIKFFINLSYYRLVISNKLFNAHHRLLSDLDKEMQIISAAEQSVRKGQDLVVEYSKMWKI